MIGQIITDEKTGEPLDHNGGKLALSEYQPPTQIMDLFSKVMMDYQSAWRLQFRPFREFDGYSLLQRTRLDQELFGAYVGAEWVAVHKRWRWRGRKNTARNKLIGLLARMISGMLFPTVFARNDEDEEDKTTARAMQILVEDYLRKANYEMKFLYMVLTALVNPATIVQVEYVEALQTIKQRMQDGSIKIEQAVDELLSGLNLHVVPVDELLIADFYTNDIQRQPYLLRVRRIPWDEARKIWGDNPNFKYVQAGKTRIVMAGQDMQTLYDIEWTEADADYVQIITAQYRPEDLEVVFVGGVFMGNEDDCFNTNPMNHRRFMQINGEWGSAPIYEYAKSYFEPIDPTGRFFYGKSGAFKEYWDDATQNKMHQLWVDGTSLDVMKPIFLSGVAKADSTVIAPGATIGMPVGASATPYQLGPNLNAAQAVMNKQEADMSESTQDKIMQGVPDPNMQATIANQAERNARIFLGVFGLMIADLVRQIGFLTMDNIIEHATVGELMSGMPEDMRMKYQTLLAKGKDQGKDVTHRIVFTDKYIGRGLTGKEAKAREFDLWQQAGGKGSDQRIWEINPYRFARMRYSVELDADQMIMKSMGADQQRKILAFQMFSNPIVQPYVDMETVVNDFVIDEFADGDPDKYKKKGDVNELMGGMMGSMGGAQPAQNGPVPSPMVGAAQPNINVSM